MSHVLAMTDDRLTGYIDHILPDGSVEGWARSADDFEALPVCLVVDDEPIGAGIANLYRGDLITAGLGNGWHGFKIQVNADFGKRKSAQFVLIETQNASVVAARELTLPKSWTPLQTVTPDAILKDRVSEVTDIQSLAGAADTLELFIKQHGAELFVERAYCYVLGRPADASGLTHYANLIAAGSLTPLNLLEALARSEERAKALWPMLPPVDPGFPFAPEA